MKQTHLMYGLVTGIVMIVIYLVLYISGLAFKPGMQYISYIPMLIGLILNANAYAKANDGFVTFGNVFSSCFKACALITILLLVWSFISTFIFPEMMDKGMEMARQSMSDRGMSDDKIEQSMEWTRKYFKLFMVAGVIFGTMFWGAILSLIAAAIPKKKGPNPNMGM